jgi:glycerol-3-phosphate acyltransferase PlsX
VKSHGGANEKGIANAIHVAARLVEDDLSGRIAEDLARMKTIGSEELVAK